MSEVYPSLSTVGGLITGDLLSRIGTGDPAVPMIDPTTYGLQRTESISRQAERSWRYLRDIWQDFAERLERQDRAGELELTRQRWLLILLRELGFTALAHVGGIDLADKSYPISHVGGDVAVHLLGWETDLDHRTPGKVKRPPQSMVQEFLNRSEEHLWGILSNGAVLRILRDSRTLTGTAYIEFDLQRMFDGQAFSDFLLLYRVAHRSRFEPPSDDSGGLCPLEQWMAYAAETGVRALERLRGGVEEAIGAIGTGFLENPDNRELLLDRVGRPGGVSIPDFNRAILRTVYRLLFWFVLEDRGLLLDPEAPAQAVERYRTYFSAKTLRRLAMARHGDQHTDRWELVTSVVFHWLGDEAGLPHLGLPGIGGLFETGRLDEPLAGAQLSNHRLFQAVRALAIVRDVSSGHRRRVDFGHLDSDELGSVYEGLLEQFPRFDPEEKTYRLERLAGNERKGTGSYYTPDSLVDRLLDDTLDPVLDEACRAADPESAILDVTVCDPACGSGHFLVAAARRIAKRLAAVRSGDPEPTAAAMRSALREVVGRCVYGVDINPMAVELAKVSLSLEAVEPGKPLAFLERNIRIGNTLLGTTPRLLREGIPDAAFDVLTGDDPKVCTGLRRANSEEGQGGQDSIWAAGEIDVSTSSLSAAMAMVRRSVPDSLEDAHVQARRATALFESPAYRHAKLLADTWCAAFVQKKMPGAQDGAIVQPTLKALAAYPEALSSAQVLTVEELTTEYRFFHWHLEFPQIFRTDPEPGDVLDPETGWSGGFSCVLGNPPWERVKLQEQEFFASRNEKIAKAANAAARKRAIAALETSDDGADQKLHAEFQVELRRSEGVGHLLRNTGRYPLTGTGDINTYAVFAETGRTVLAPAGRMGMVLPTGIATDKTTSAFFRDVVRGRRLVSLLEFENEAFILSKQVDHRVRFCLLALAGRAIEIESASFAFSVRFTRNLDARTFAMPPAEILLVNPNTGTCPVFKSRRDAELVIDIYRSVPVLWRDDPEENPWELRFLAMFHMANDSHLFKDADSLRDEGWTQVGSAFAEDGRRMLPLYEAKMVSHYDHRLGTYEGQTEKQANVGTLPRTTPEQHDDPAHQIVPRYWVPEFDVDTGKKDRRRKPVLEPGVTSRLEDKEWRRGWLLGWRDICRSTDVRTLICSPIPRMGVGDKFLLALSPASGATLAANCSAFVLDYVARQKIAGTAMKYFTVKQLPVLPPEAYDGPTAWNGEETLGDWVTRRVLELSYTAWDMEAFARDHGDQGAPFRWHDERRQQLRAELDAAYFRLYGIAREDVDYIMETFPIVRRNDERAYGEFRTKRLILEAYDAMDEAEDTGETYSSPLTPPPGDGPRHPESTRPPWATGEAKPTQPLGDQLF